MQPCSSDSTNKIVADITFLGTHSLVDFMPLHIKHMDKMHKISVISNSPLFQLSVG